MLRILTPWHSKALYVRITNRYTMLGVPVIIDTDPGVDDAFALFMALNAHRQGIITIVAITTVSGNTLIENVNINVHRVLQVSEMLEEVPVYSGARQPLVTPLVREEDPFMGEDGLGDAQHNCLPSLDLIRKEAAAEAIRRLVNERPNDIYLVALGPLTNVSLASQLDGNLLRKLKGFYVMGGSRKGLGNMTPWAEFNTYCDPESAFVVLRDTPQVIKLVDYDVCVEKCGLSNSELDEIFSPSNKITEFMRKIQVNPKKKLNPPPDWVEYDAVSLAWLLDDLAKENGPAFIEKRLVLKTKEIYATIELQGKFTRGQMLVDNKPKLKNKANIEVIENLDRNALLDYYKKACHWNHTP